MNSFEKAVRITLFSFLFISFQAFAESCDSNGPASYRCKITNAGPYKAHFVNASTNPNHCQNSQNPQSFDVDGASTPPNTFFIDIQTKWDGICKSNPSYLSYNVTYGSDKDNLKTDRLEILFEKSSSSSDLPTGTLGTTSSKCEKLKPKIPSDSNLTITCHKLK